MSLLILLPAALSASALAIAVLTFNRRTWNRVPIVLGGLAWVLLCVLVVAGEHDPEVSGAAFTRGLLIAGGLMALTPWVLYSLLGWLLARHPIVLAIVWAASIVPLYYFEFVVFLLAVGNVGCPPGAYECPV
jgi:hypothetical protein